MVTRRVGQCIYCDSRELPLSKEHIIPYALGGIPFLEKASCARCQKETRTLEGRLLRGPWWPHRRRLDLPSRHPEEQPESFEVTVAKTPKGEYTVQIPASKYPGLVVLRFGPPAILLGQHVAGEPIASGAGFMFTADRAGPTAQELLNLPLGTTYYEVTASFKLEVADFVRFLAKVALAHAVAEYGLKGFVEFFIRDLVLGKTEGALTYVGQAASSVVPPVLPGPGLHALVARRHGDLVSVYVQLFREIGDPTPIYEVVVGRLDPTAK